MGSNPTKGTSVDSSSIGRAPDCGFGGCEFDSRLSTQYREVAQFGRALGLGPRGRRFKSCLPYHAGVAQLVERKTCNFDVTGSNPVTSSRRVSYNGITSGFQPDDAGSIPVTRSTLRK